ncbi:hypothetical protein [Paenibacillus sp.]|uniref:hypothetical protein n=1 Tax=Paenibacillus sp. TaxID=58172 RepID=UPI002D31ADA9|nr:hypothetical protein [Paenibacillus sp.]HZG58480.1 hypothetical protein [Paenibacillus sp.]
MTRTKLASQAKSLLGRDVAVRLKDGKTASGKLVRIQGGRLYIRPAAGAKGKPVATKALLPLLLYDVAALGAAAASPYTYGYGYGGVPHGYAGAYGPYGYGYGYGVPGGFWL